MSGKSGRIKALWQGRDSRGWDGRYAAYFDLFNRGDYYEAHDVLESLWLEQGRTAPSARFYQGLIQLAGGFVHLRKHFEDPTHRVHGKRLDPAARLLRLAHKNIMPYGSGWEGLEIGPILKLAESTIRKLEDGKFAANPWAPGEGPQIRAPSPRD